MNYQHLAKKLRLPLGFVFGIGYLLFAGPRNGYMGPLTLAVGVGWSEGATDGAADPPHAARTVSTTDTARPAAPPGSRRPPAS